MSLASAFRASCALYAERPALRASGDGIAGLDTTLSYAELLAAAEAVAAALGRLRLPPHSLVGICLERSAGLVAAMLGVILAGHAYLPLDPAYPEARLRAALADAKPAVVLLGQAPASALADTGVRLLTMSGTEVQQPHSPAPPTLATGTHEDPDALAYVLYTSGSTGAPKGVMVSHRNVLRLFRETEPWFGFTPDDVWTMFHSFSFDFSVWEMWGPLLTGGRLVVVPFSTSRDPELFRALLSRERVTVLNQTPTAFKLLAEADQPATSPLALRVVIFGGEALHPRALLPWIERHGDERPQLVNMYGITETTVHVTYRRIIRQDAEHETESVLGEPIPDLLLHVLDEQLRPVPVDTPGELYVGGAGVALGYLGQPDLTAERFLQSPFSSSPVTRLYRTGDLARRRVDGQLVFLGRADRQVKINGFRIELGEVEAVLHRCPAVRQLAVATHPDLAAGPRLVACFTLQDSHSADEVSQFAAAQLPAHMRPSLYRQVERLPLTLNGKLDLSGLPALQPATATPGKPASSLPEIVAEAWQQVLGHADISPQQNFFDAGGTSLQLIGLRTVLQTRLQRTIPITWLFQHTTIDTLSRRLAEPADAPALTPIAPANPAAQRGLWLAAQAHRRKAGRGAAR